MGLNGQEGRCSKGDMGGKREWARVKGLGVGYGSRAVSLQMSKGKKEKKRETL